MHLQGKKKTEMSCDNGSVYMIAFDVLVHITKWRNNRQPHSDTFQEANASANELVLPKAFAIPQYVSGTGLNPHQTLYI